MGRTRIQINKKQVEKLIAAGWREPAIAEFFEVAVGTIGKKYPRLFKRGRPAKVLTEALLKTARVLSSINCTEDEMAVGLDVCKAKFDTWKDDPDFSETIHQGRLQGCVSLRRKKFELALAGNVAMLIWEAKQRLGERDKQDIESHGDMELHFVEGPGLLPEEEWERQVAEEQAQRNDGSH